jgi:hypothetical protein
MMGSHSMRTPLSFFVSEYIIKHRQLIFLALIICASCSQFVPEQCTIAVLSTSEHKQFSITTEIDSGKKWVTFTILPRLGTKKTDIVLPELKGKPCNITVSLLEVGSTSPGNTYTKTHFDFGESRPAFSLPKNKKNNVTINVLFEEAIQANIMFDIILFAQQKMDLP